MAEVVVDDSMTLNIDDTYEYLSGIFPNADPLYLRSAAEKFEAENDVKNFVENKLQSNEHPTRTNPFTHFEDETRKCQYNLIAAEFLKNAFSHVRVNTINRIYRSSKYNMSIAARELRFTTDFIVKPRRSREIPTENILLLQEMAFVRHREVIRIHMAEVKRKEEDEFNALKAAGGFWTCQCCYDEECIPLKCSTCENAHVFCNSCVVKGTDTKLGDGETQVPCFLNCGSEFSMSTLQKVLPPAKFSILLQKRQAAEVLAAGLEGLVSCPFCPFASIPPEGDKVFKCLNPECMKESCILCKEPNHVPFNCGQQEKKDKARKYIEEKMTQALTRSCYQCKKVFFKEEGCNLMTCPCKAMMCFICNSPVKNYQHFNGQGSDDVSSKCPLWTDNGRLNAETVRKVEEAARREILRQDPTLDINTTGLAAALPPPTSGPHDNAPDTNNIAN
ncbi:E3 ubiquitin-protein ligase RNF216-like, partial [Choristoneura fumiferana]|uniref:E3 ubiquitin-protein ligase RNF216-like n=1 Tax=Choristoneura fumiferana TaxID=7141 RepID=UPI003D15BB89